MATETRTFDLLGSAAVVADAPGAGDAQQGSCAGDIRTMLDAAAVGNESWALQMVDATAKLPEPLLRGLRVHLGDFDECLAARPPRFHARYCLASVRGPRGSARAGLRVAMCVPSSCGPKDLEAFLAGTVGVNASVHPASCQPEPPTHLHPATVVFFVVVGLMSLLLVAAWGVERWVAQRGEDKPLQGRLKRASDILAALSPRRSWNKIFSRGTPAPLDSLAGFRVVSMAWVVLGHHAVTLKDLPLLDFHTTVHGLFEWSRFYLPGALYAVDTFIFMSGLLVAYTTLRHRRVPKTLKEYLLFCLHRYIRITPILAFTMLAYAGVYGLLGSGPLWPELVAFGRDKCRSYWWVNLLYIHNYYNNVNMCVGHSWYLAVDMQLYLISPIFLLAFAKKRSQGRFAVAVALLLSTLAVFLLVFLKDLPGVVNPLQEPGDDFTFTFLVYIPTHARIGPWLLGMLLGAWLADREEEELEHGVRLKLAGRRHGAALWAAAAILLLGVLLLTTLQMRWQAAAGLRLGDRPSSLECAAFAALSRLAWGAGVGAAVAACALGRGGWASALLASRPMLPLARLSFTVYMLHPAVQATFLFPQRTPTVGADFALWPAVVAELVVSFALAVPVTLLFESPFIVLERELLRRAPAPAEAVAAPAAPPEAPALPAVSTVPTVSATVPIVPGASSSRSILTHSTFVTTGDAVRSPSRRPGVFLRPPSNIFPQKYRPIKTF